ncbi:MAG TPA: glycosyltransferase family 39 protein [Candidatus Binatia bacterium]|nr:glycosyltransferase family 39 protein [Candidatus Binatia bacterium]
MTNRTRTDALLLAGFCAFLFFYGLAQFGLIGADEPRYAQVAREMLERRDWVTPTLGGHAWLEKPPLYYWQAMAAYSVFGVNDWSARLPSAFDATLLVLAVYFFLRRFRPGAELDGALMVASCAGVIGYARAASTDMPLTAALGVALLAWWAWRESGSRVYLAAFYAFIALATLAKGPVAVLLAAGAIALYVAAFREWRLIGKTLWLPGIVLFCVIALPWYIAAQERNSQFFHEFILQHNLERFSQNLYHHPEPLWYYLPVSALALVPWTIFVLSAATRTVRVWISERNSTTADTDWTQHFRVFCLCWLLTPIVFFSFSQSKLPGYILPAIPAGGLLLGVYVREQLQNEDDPVPRGLVVLHALLSSAPLVPALLIAYLTAQHRLPGGAPMYIAMGVAFVLCAAIALTLARRGGLRMLRFVTLIPVVLTIGAVLKLGAVSLDETLSARPLANEISAMESRQLPLAVYHIHRELEYGLTFYRNQLTLNYGWGTIPKQEHLLVAPEHSQVEIGQLMPGRRVSYLGHDAAQHVDYFWIAPAAGVPAIPQ